MPIVGTPFLCKQCLTEEVKKEKKKNIISIKMMIMLTHFCITFAPSTINFDVHEDSKFSIS